MNVDATKHTFPEFPMTPMTVAEYAQAMENARQQQNRCPHAACPGKHAWYDCCGQCEMGQYAEWQEWHEMRAEEHLYCD